MSFQPKRILAATDFSSCSRNAVNIALDLSRTYEASLTLVHVIPLAVYPDVAAGAVGPSAAQLDYYGSIHEAVVQNWREEEELCRAQGVTISTVTREGSAAAEILRLAGTDHFDLVVVGTHGRSGLKHLLIGSVAEAVVRRCPVPVLTIREHPATTVGLTRHSASDLQTQPPAASPG